MAFGDPTQRKEGALRAGGGEIAKEVIHTPLDTALQPVPFRQWNPSLEPEEVEVLLDVHGEVVNHEAIGAWEEVDNK
jgi:hypothetical protein